MIATQTIRVRRSLQTIFANLFPPLIRLKFLNSARSNSAVITQRHSLKLDECLVNDIEMNILNEHQSALILIVKLQTYARIF